MFKYILTFLLVLFTTAVQAQQRDNIIITKFEPGSSPYMMLRLFTVHMNTLSDERYTIIYVPGANGENALERALTIASSRNVLVYGGLSNFVYSEINPKNPERYRSEFRQMKLITLSYASVFVHKNSGISSITDLVSFLKNKKEIFNTSTERINNPILLNSIFLKTSNLPPSKTIRYKTFGELIKSLAHKETDYGLMNMENDSELVMLMNSSAKSNTNLAGISLGYKDFVHETVLVFFTPKNETKFDMYFKHIDLVCVDKKEQIVDLAMKSNYIYECQENEKKLNTRIKKEILRLE